MGVEPDTGSTTAKTVAVLGGGLAGMSAARRLLELGFGVVLVEKRPFLGGRAFSFRDPESGVEIDNGQHVFLGCNRHYFDYLREIGAVDKAYVQDRLRAEVVRNGVSGVLSSTPSAWQAAPLPVARQVPAPDRDGQAASRPRADRDESSQTP